MAVIVYLDETGDHTLELVDKEFPLFALVMLICDIDVYTQQIVPAFYKLKFDYFGHEGVIIHSRDIRKAQGEFGFLTRPEARQPFYTRINDIMGQMSYSLIASVIHKEKHKDRYGIGADNPYDLALKFAMERLLPLVESMGQREVRLIAEARGKREDAELALCFTRIMTHGSEYISPQRFNQVVFRLDFKRKEMNIIGNQMADLAAYPIARYILDPSKPNPAYSIVASKLYHGPGHARGLKVFP